MFQRERVVELNVPEINEYGTGYLIGPRLVLTCAHGLTRAGAGEPGAAVQVRFRLGTDGTRVVAPEPSAQPPESADPLASLEQGQSSSDEGEPGPSSIRPANVHLAAEVVWIRHDATIDAALLRIVDKRWQEPEHLLHIRWGILAAADPDVPVMFDGAGFPLVRKGPDPADTAKNLRDVEQFVGRLSAGTDQLRHRHEITVLVDHRKQDPKRSPWAGLSGAAVFCGPHLTAVVIQDPVPGNRRDRLRALPVSELARIPSFVAEVEHGTGVPFVMEPVGPADVLEDPVQFRTPASRRALPGWLLRADAEVVRFRGRERLLGDFERWCEGRGLGVALLVGDGGAGKSRFARELTTRMRQRHQWVAGQLSRDATPDRIMDAFTRLQLPLLVVVDYAETRTDVLPTLISAAGSAAGTCPVRVLLLARSRGGWWDNVKTSDPKAGQWVDKAWITRLGSLETEPSGRKAAYREAVECFARHLDGPGARTGTWQETGARVVDERLRSGRGSFQEERFDSVLGLHMQALADLLQAGRNPVLGVPASEVEQILLDHEKRYWHQTWEELFSGSAAARFAQLVDGSTRHAAVVTATLAGADNATDALSVLSRLPGLQGNEVLWELASRWLRVVYPPPTGQYWGSLIPDRLGEYLVASYLRTTPGYLVAVVPKTSRAQRLRMLTVIARASQHQDGLLDPLDAVMKRNADLLIPPAVRIAGIVQNPEILHKAISENKRYIRDPDTYRTAFWDFERPSTERKAYEQDFGERAIEAARSPEEKAEFLARHADHLSTSGEHKEAIEAAQQAVDLRRRELGQDEDSRWGLALALHTLGVVSARAASLDQSRAALTEALTVVDSLDTEHSRHRIVFMTLQAGVRNNLGKTLAQVGPLDEAETHLKDAISRYRQLCELSDSDDLRRFFAGSLADYGAVLTGFIPVNPRLAKRKRAEAREAFAEARAIFEDLAERFPDQYLPALAHTLQNLAGAQDKRGPAIVAAERAVDVSRKLCSKNPAYREELAFALMRLAMLRGSRIFGDKQAKGILREAIDTYDRCPQLKPESRHDYLKGLLEVVTDFRNARSEGDVYPLADKGVRHARLLCDEQPHQSHELLLIEFLEFKAWSGACLVERQEEAAAAAREAWEIFESFDPKHLIAQDLRKRVLKRVEYTEQMLNLRREMEEFTVRTGLGTAEEIRKQVKQMEDDATPGQHAGVRAEALLVQRRFAEAEPLARQCLEQVELYVAGQPREYWLRIAAVVLLGNALQGQKRYSEASTLYQECLDDLPDLLRREPPPHYLDLVAQYTHCLRCENRPEQILRLLETAIPRARGMAHRRVVNQSLYADLLERQAEAYFDQADLHPETLDAAAASVLDAIEVRRLTAERNLALRYQSVPTLMLAAYIQGERRHYDDAYVYAERAREAYRAATAEQRDELGPDYSIEVMDDLLVQLRDARS